MLDLKGSAGATLLSVKAAPGSSRPGIKGELGGKLKVALASPPEKGKANRELIALLTERTGIPEAQITIKSGHGSPMKTVRIEGVCPETLAALLS